MAPNFRYRYVDFGTVFISDSRPRDLESAAASPGTLFANELAIDVGGSCWGLNEPLPILDHHFLREAQFPSASAAVLHKAHLIRERFAALDGPLWLVTHREPDFDAFCSMYLARWIIADPAAPGDWTPCGLHPDGWLDLRDLPKIDWFNPQTSAAPPQHCWALLLAAYASVLETRHRIACPRTRDLRSVLYAALKRGRDYLSESSGATEFFDEVRAVLQHRALNPIFDSVLEESSLFAPERAMLDREAATYLRDIARARQATVYLPQAEAPSPDFFKVHKGAAASPEGDAEHLLLADTFRIPTDAIYLRDPECLLFKEWARVDIENSARGAGFEFTAIATSHDRPAASINQTDYAFYIDPERADGRHLYTVWSRLQTQEVEALRHHGQRVAAAPTGQSNPTLGALLADPWLGGQSRFGTAVDTPSRGTLIGPPGIRADLRDDPVVEAVRTELENCIYTAASLVTGPQVQVLDLDASPARADLDARHFDFNDPLRIPAPQPGYFRFAQVGLRADVPLNQPRLAAQIGDALWQVLYPEAPGSTPPDFLERHLVIAADSVGVWGDRGMAVAQKQDSTELRDSFSALVSLARDSAKLADDAGSVDPEEVAELQGIAATGADLARRAAELKHTLTLPGRDLLRRFAEVIALDPLLAAARDLAQTAAGHLRRHSDEQHDKQAAKRAAGMVHLQSKLEWLQVFIIGLIAVGAVDGIASYVNIGSAAQDALLLLAGPLVMAVTASVLKPWKRKTELRLPAGLLIVAIVVCVGAWLAGLIALWSR